MTIRVLRPEVAARIAAGEVVERPASVVKELVENALDAGATRIAVEVAGGGLDSIRVSDDGCGIEPAELETAFARHATSKLDDGEDLSLIVTLGFRGEALPSIAAVAEVQAVSRPSHCQAAAYLRLSPGAPSQQGTKGAPVGTSVTVRHLFARQPARRKFLRSAASEASAVAAVVTHCALAHPEVRFSLVMDGRQSLATTGSGYLRDALSAVYGPEVAGAMLEVRPAARARLDEATTAKGAVSVAGMVSPPHISRAGRGYISLFVNRRCIQNRRLTYAVEEAYQGMLMVGRHPIAALDLRVPYEEVDVNVHPTKAEVRFRDESAVFGAIQRAVRQALLTASPVPGGDPGQPPGPAFALAGQPAMPPLWEHGLKLATRATAGIAGVIDAASPSTAAPAVEPPAATPAQTLPVLRVIGQFGGVYIVAEGPDGMYLIDQHAAHERVLYERFLQQRRQRSPPVQGLLEPVALELAPGHGALLAQEEEALREYGFDVEPFGDGAYVLRALPRSLAGGDLRQTVGGFLDLMQNEEGGDGRDRVAMSLACHGAVRAGKTLALDEMRELIQQLEESEAPQTCPHGRPTMIHMSADVLAREFGRR